jgi:hypothetical protein
MVRHVDTRLIMAQFTVIPEAQAPRPMKQSGRLVQRMREYEQYIGSVKKGQVGQLTPAVNETARGIALRISRAGKRAGKAVRTWVVDGSVYFSVS